MKGNMTVIDLRTTINLDCEMWDRLKNEDAMFTSHLYLFELPDSRETKHYQLILNGVELWYGTLEEINAIVKSMVRQLTREADFYPWTYD